ncbi:TPA: hypothetical protein MFN53_001578 [Klebsiella pneumoniae]|nr:hypothetical protein [Klebsiella pneumoniae]TNA80257.1 hypothetical protein EME57_08235 [Klebsiella pneumoniae]HBW8850899.1 hypothetical protein [Klebsiella pneumoniae]HBX5786954.1 hypothetical protein [Klebsiella pneumoniae]
MWLRKQVNSGNAPVATDPALPALRSRSERYTSTLIRCDPSDNLMKSLRSASLLTTNGALWLLCNF